MFGLNYGWEHPLWFAPQGTAAEEDYGFDASSVDGCGGGRVPDLRNGVGIIDISNFAKYEVKGPGAGDWLDRIVANKVPRRWALCLTPMLGKRGGIVGDFTIARLAEDHYLIVGSGMAERYHKRYFDAVPKPQGVRMISRTEAWGGFNVAGPKARELLGRLTNTDLSNEGFKFMRARRTAVAGIDTVALRVSFTGDLGWELHVQEDQQLALFDALMKAGADLDARPVGSRALLSMRVEKGYGSWGREYSPVLASRGWARSPHQAG